MSKHTVLDRFLSNRQKSAKCCVPCICAIFVVISKVVKNHVIGLGNLSLAGVGEFAQC